MARKTSSRSPQSHRTYDGSLNWSPDHHQHPPLRVLRNRCGRQATASKQAPNGAYGNENLKNRVSRFAVIIADFCNKICHKRTDGLLSVQCTNGF